MSASPILIVMGTRPEAIKLAPVVAALNELACCPTRVCVTGQHRDLLSMGLSAFDVQIDYDLDLMTHDQTPADVLSRVVAEMAKVIEKEQPRWVVVQGDTTTALATALAAFHRQTPLAHVEAGLRSGDITQPWPEEMNRRLIGQIASLHLAPTELAFDNLVREGVAPESIRVTGNTVIDALDFAVAALDRSPDRAGPIRGLLDDLTPETLLVTATIHRRENHPHLDEIERVLQWLGQRDDCCVVFPAHPNPAITRLAQRLSQSRVKVVPPLGYLPFVALMQRADLILTDSGGIQEEATALGKPVLVLRERTERPEVLQAGNGLLVGTDSAAIISAVAALLDDPAARAAMAQQSAPFGDGRAARRIAAALTGTEPPDMVLPSRPPTGGAHASSRLMAHPLFLGDTEGDGRLDEGARDRRAMAQLP